MGPRASGVRPTGYADWPQGFRPHISSPWRTTGDYRDNWDVRRGYPLQQARAKAQEMLATARLGGDPQAERKARAAAEVARAKLLTVAVWCSNTRRRYGPVTVRTSRSRGLLSATYLRIPHGTWSGSSTDTANGQRRQSPAAMWLPCSTNTLTSRRHIAACMGRLIDYMPGHDRQSSSPPHPAADMSSGPVRRENGCCRSKSWWQSGMWRRISINPTGTWSAL